MFLTLYNGKNMAQSSGLHEESYFLTLLQRCDEQIDQITGMEHQHAFQ